MGAPQFKGARSQKAVNRNIKGNGRSFISEVSNLRLGFKMSNKLTSNNSMFRTNEKFLLLFLYFLLFSIINTRNITGVYGKELKEKFATSDSGTTTDSSSTVTKIDTDVLMDNIREIGYYLRAHKFNEYDRRYEVNATTAERIYFKSFPRPPLRALHWEVHKFCESSFMECVAYLGKKIRATAARRHDDTSIIMMEEKWTWNNNTEQIMQVDEECRKNKQLDDRIADPFEGPLERYQWRVTASYFMCWYTMKETPELKHFNEKCDNFANCLDNDFGPNNDDARVSDYESFSCSFYSFCPDPCCPLKYVNIMSECWNSPENPCFRQNTISERQCSSSMKENTEHSDIILNRWNVTCRCPQQRGYEWNSRYGICIDVDECVSKTHNCKPKVESCLNLPGSFRCICHWGYVWEEEKNECLLSASLAGLKLKRKENKNVKKLNLWEKFKNIIFRRNCCPSNTPHLAYVCFSILVQFWYFSWLPI